MNEVEWIKESQEDEDNFAEKAKKIDFKPLEEKISSVIGEEVKLKVNINEPKKKISLYSQNLASKAGVMASVLEELIVTDFGSDYIKKEDSMWIPTYFSWEFKEGGSNAHRLFTSWYLFKDKKWTFK